MQSLRLNTVNYAKILFRQVKYRWYFRDHSKFRGKVLEGMALQSSSLLANRNVVKDRCWHVVKDRCWYFCVSGSYILRFSGLNRGQTWPVRFSVALRGQVRLRDWFATWWDNFNALSCFKSSFIFWFVRNATRGKINKADEEPWD
jgi:hypothetical protein